MKQCCKTCRFFDKSKQPDAVYGDCTCPVPSSVITKAKWLLIQDRDGTTCLCYQPIQEPEEAR